MEGHLLQDIVVVFGLSIAVLLVCHRLHIPSIVGFLFTGVLCGPYGTGLISVTADVQLLAEIGIVLLLFSVGLEFSIKRLLEHKRFFLIGGSMQVGVTIAIGYFIAQLLERPVGESVFLGFLLSLSSTAIVLRMLDRRKEVTTPHGKVILGILIFQDIAVIPMMLITPYISQDAKDTDPNIIGYLLQSIIVLGAVFFGATQVVPKMMHVIARTRNRELFLLAILTICFAVAWVSSKLGLSLPLGAFLAGLIVSETEYRNEAVEDILPFQDVFTSFFFISIGMLLNVNFIVEYPFSIAFITLGVLLFKFLIVGATATVLGAPLRTSILVGLALCQVGEFSFVLAREGMQMGVSDNYHFQLFLAVAVLTMAVTPFLIQIAPLVAEWAMTLPVSDRIKAGYINLEEKSSTAKEDHVIIIGYGVPGQILATSCREAKIPYAITEIDAALVNRYRREGEPIFYGDATHVSVLEHLNVAKAQAVAVLINDPLASLRVVEHARHLNDKAYIIVRTRWLQEMNPLFQLGADDVIPDEFGASVEVFARILRKNNVNPEEIRRFIAEARHEEFQMIRQLYKEPTSLLSVSELGVGTIKVGKKSQLIGKVITECPLKEDYHVNPVMIRRGDKTIMQFDPNTLVMEGDIIVIVGPEDNLALASKELSV